MSVAHAREVLQTTRTQRLQAITMRLEAQGRLLRAQIREHERRGDTTAAAPLRAALAEIDDALRDPGARPQLECVSCGATWESPVARQMALAGSGCLCCGADLVEVRS